MDNSTDLIEVSKRNYLESIRKKKGAYDRIVIYGAGRKAVGLYKFLKENGIAVDAFCVTDKKSNKEIECGLHIYELRELKSDSIHPLFLIGVRKRWNKEIVEFLRANNFYNYIEAPEGIEYFLSEDFDRNKRAVLQITAQVGCRINCRYCPQKLFVQKYSEGVARAHKMTFDLFKKYIDKTESDVIIDFAGFSEPFFNKECIQMIVYAYKTGHDIELFTTLEGLSKEQFYQIKDIPFREVVLHIPDKNGNSNIDITDDYLELLKEILDAKRKNGSAFADWASCHGEPAERIKDLVDGRIRVISKLHDRGGNLDEPGLEKGYALNGLIRCSGAEALNHNVLLPDGTVLLCDSDWGLQHILGNLGIDSYNDILQGEVLCEIKRKMHSKNEMILCRNCCYAEEIEGEAQV